MVGSPAGQDHPDQSAAGLGTAHDPGTLLFRAAALVAARCERAPRENHIREERWRGSKSAPHLLDDAPTRGRAGEISRGNAQQDRRTAGREERCHRRCLSRSSSDSAGCIDRCGRDLQFARSAPEARVTVAIGEPFTYLRLKEACEAKIWRLREFVENRLASLLSKEYRGIYAQEPRLL